MDWTVCSRETERDYTWDHAYSTTFLANLAQETFALAFEGSLTASRFVTLLRYPDSSQDVMLGVSVSTVRKDFHNRPIRTMAFLHAETFEESNLLSAFFAECLREPDAKTFYDAESPLAKAVESLYLTKKPDDFIEFCKGLPMSDEVSASFAQRWAIPRDRIADRKKVADALPSLVERSEPFLLALTDRVPTDVLASLGSIFDHATVRIFSKGVTISEKLPDPSSQKYVRAATIGGAAILALLVAAINESWRGGGNGGPNPATNVLTHAGNGGACHRNSGINVAPSEGVVKTNAPTGGTDDGTNTATNRLDPERIVTVGSTNVPPQTRAETVNTSVPSTNTANRTGNDGVLNGNSGTNIVPSKGVAETNAPTGGTDDGTNSTTNRLGTGGLVPAVSAKVPPQTQSETVNKEQHKENL